VAWLRRPILEPRLLKSERHTDVIIAVVESLVSLGATEYESDILAVLPRISNQIVATVKKKLEKLAAKPGLANSPGLPPSRENKEVVVPSGSVRVKLPVLFVAIFAATCAGYWIGTQSRAFYYAR